MKIIDLTMPLGVGTPVFPGGRLAGKRFTCYALPLKLKDADGAPCRVIGVLE